MATSPWKLETTRDELYLSGLARECAQELQRERDREREEEEEGAGS